MAKEKNSAEIVEVTRSFARKLNMAAHGGKQYETADIVCTITAKTDDIEETSKYLDELCQKEVNATIAALDGEADEVEEAEVPAPKEKKKKSIDLGVKVEQDELQEISEYMNDLTLAKTAKDLKEAAIKIKENMSKFSDVQKKYLTAYYAKRKEAIA